MAFAQMCDPGFVPCDSGCMPAGAICCSLGSRGSYYVPPELVAAGFTRCCSPLRLAKPEDTCCSDTLVCSAEQTCGAISEQLPTGCDCQVASSGISWPISATLPKLALGEASLDLRYTQSTPSPANGSCNSAPSHSGSAEICLPVPSPGIPKEQVCVRGNFNLTGSCTAPKICRYGESMGSCDLTKACCVKSGALTLSGTKTTTYSIGDAFRSFSSLPVTAELTYSLGIGGQLNIVNSVGPLCTPCSDAYQFDVSLFGRGAGSVQLAAKLFAAEPRVSVEASVCAALGMQGTHCAGTSSLSPNVAGAVKVKPVTLRVGWVSLSLPSVTSKYGVGDACGF